MKVVVICGASGSGKSTLIGQILMYNGKSGLSCTVLKTRDYYLEIPAGVDLQVYKQTTNFDRPKRLDFLLLKNHILSLLAGESIEKPIFDRTTEKRIGVEAIIPTDILIIDGSFSLYFAQQFMPDLKAIFKIFVQTSPEILLDRRIPRDLGESRYHDEKEIREFFYRDILPSYFKYIQPAEKIADLIINNDKHGIEHLEIWAKKIVEILKDFIPAQTKTPLILPIKTVDKIKERAYVRGACIGFFAGKLDDSVASKISTFLDLKSGFNLALSSKTAAQYAEKETETYLSANFRI